MASPRLILKLEDDIKNYKLSKKELIDKLQMSEKNTDFYKDLWITAEKKFHALRQNYLDPLKEEVNEMRKNLQKLSQENLRMTDERAMESDAFMEAFEQMFIKYPDNTLIL